MTLRCQKSALQNIERLLDQAWNELQTFLVAMPLPTPKAALLLALIVGLLAIFVAILTAVVRRYVARAGEQKLPLSFVSEPGDDRVARVTKARLDALGFKERARVTVRTDASDRRYVIALLLTRNASSKFDDNNVALSHAALSKLGLSGPSNTKDDDSGPVPKIYIEPLPWYWLSGVAYRTILDPDRNVSLTWIVTLVSTIVGLVISEIYFQREMAYQAAPPALRPSINDVAGSQ